MFPPLINQILGIIHVLFTVVFMAIIMKIGINFIIALLIISPLTMILINIMHLRGFLQVWLPSNKKN